MSFTSLLNTTATIERPTLVRSSTGEVTWSFATVAAGVATRVEPDQGSGIEVRDDETGATLVGTHYAYLLFAADVQDHDRFTTVAGEVYRVIRVDDAGGHGHHLEVRLSQPDGRVAA